MILPGLAIVPFRTLRSAGGLRRAVSLKLIVVAAALLQGTLVFGNLARADGAGTGVAAADFPASLRLASCSPAQTSLRRDAVTECGLDQQAVPTDQDSEGAPLAPKVFGFSSEARDGDVVFIQGANLDTSSVVYRGGGTMPETALPVVSRIGTRWLAVQLPSPLPDPVVLRVRTAYGSSAPLRLNAAHPLHLDATRLVPGGQFRVLGRKLKIPGSIPRLLIDGEPATVDLDTSNDSMLVARVPSTLTATPGARILVDNGNGTGATPLDGLVPVELGSGDPVGLGVGWAAGFTFADHVIEARATCDGRTDDTQPLQAAVFQAGKDGGGIVQVPSGTCRITGTVNLASRVILRGAGQDATILKFEGNYPIYAEKFDLVGLQDLTLVNGSGVEEGMIWRRNTRSFIKHVRIDMAISRQWFLTLNRDFVFDGNVIEQIGSISQQNPYRFDHSAGLVFSNNHTTNVSGSPTFQGIHDAVFLNNRFTRDARSQDESPVIAHHGFVADFSFRISVIGNTFDVINGPIRNTLRNDGETILVEGGGPFRTENVGTVESATADTLTDGHQALNLDPFETGRPANYGVAIVSGIGAGQTRHVIGRDGATLRLDRPWDVVPDTSSHYSSFVWALENALIKDNVLVGNPRGIWIYQSAVRDVAVVGNTIREGGGIYFRSYQNLAQKIFTVQQDCLIADNHVENTSGAWMSYVTLANVNADALAFGTGEIGIEVRRNRVVANVPNVSSAVEDHAGQEGFAGLVYAEGGNGRLNDTPNMLGTIFQDNVCEHCDRPFTIGTGSFGTVLVGNQPDVIRPNVLLDVKMMDNRAGASTGTLAR